MSRPINDLAAALGVIGKRLPGWTVSRPLDTEAITVASPRGVTFLDGERFWTPTSAEQALAAIGGLGYDEDRERLRHRPVPQAMSQPAPTTKIPEPVTEIEPVPPVRKPKFTTFVYPDDAQEIPLELLLPPEGGDGEGQRYMLPSVVIDGDIAKAFADRAVDEHNRKPRKSNKDTFKRLMVDGKLLQTHQGVAFNTLGELTDGRHRMLALWEIAETNPDATIVVDITYNMPVKTAFAYDGGAKRTNQEHAQVANIDQANVVARLCNNLHKHLQTVGRAANWKDVPALLPDEVVELAEKHGEGLVEAWDAVKRLKRVKGLNLNAAAIWYYLAKQAWPDAPVDEFVHGLAEMEWTYPDDPRKGLHRWATHSTERRVDMRHHLGNIMATYNDFCQQQPRQLNKWLPAWGIAAPYAPDSSKPRRRAAKTTAAAKKRR